MEIEEVACYRFSTLFEKGFN